MSRSCVRVHAAECWYFDIQRSDAGDDSSLETEYVELQSALLQVPLTAYATDLLC
jgi:hypothetical protein